MNNPVRILSIALIVAGGLISITPASAQQTLTGDKKLACEAVLCLASGKRPDECNPALRRYFDISKRLWKDTVKARKNFLKLCPTSSDTSSADMPALIDAIANGAGRCDAAYLNQANRHVVYRRVCNGVPNGPLRTREMMAPRDPDQDGCSMQPVVVISANKPAYCAAYTANPNTYMLGVQYVGDPQKGGHWVDAAGGQ